MKASGPTVPKAPCQVACPAGTDAGRYVGLIGAGRYDDAYAVAAEVNPFPSVCGWICTAPCEAVCRRGVLDEPIAIRTLKRFAAEHGSCRRSNRRPSGGPRRSAIVGGGPAGMSAAYYLARLGYPVTVFEAMPVPGGMMAIGIPSYRLPRDVLQAEIARIVGLGVDLRLDAAMGRDFTLGDLEQQGYRAIFLVDRRLEEPAARRPRRRRSRGRPGDAVPQAGQPRRGAAPERPGRRRRRRQHGDGRGALGLAERCVAGDHRLPARPGRDAGPGRGDRGGRARGDRRPDRPRAGRGRRPRRRGRRHPLRRDAAGRRRRRGGRSRTPGSRSPAPRRSSRPTTILVAVGEEPDPSILPEGAGIEVSGWAGIVADPRTLATGRAGVFAGGDVVSGPKTIIDAVASGRRAAASIHEYLAGVADGEAEILATVRYRDRARAAR